MPRDAPTLDQVRTMLEVRAGLAYARNPEAAAGLWQSIRRVRDGSPETTLAGTAASLAPDADADQLREGELILSLLAIADKEYPKEVQTLEARVDRILCKLGS